MSMAGGSHTAFDASAFGAGALGGAGAIAGALALGVTNYRAAQAQRWNTWNAEQLRAALDLSEAFRAREAATIAGLRRDLATARTAVARLERDAAVRAARRLPR
ncbi:MAG: hypothetical protein JWO56_1989 [Acidobacteria bacterium]|nr:hypothetical protein [Acidobacteriota bacterium]